MALTDPYPGGSTIKKNNQWSHGMNVLVFNCGSSSQSARLYKVEAGGKPQILATLKANNVDTLTSASPEIVWQIAGQTSSRKAQRLTHRDAAEAILELLHDHGQSVEAVGHRFVHGGDYFNATARVTDDVLNKLRVCFPLAPIHNPNSFSVIDLCLDALPEIPQFAVFDTAFHTGLPEAAKRYALSLELTEKFGYRKYGFHGLSCQYVSAKAAGLLGKPLDQVKLIICHLGSGGSSVTAFADGHSVDTSMGYSPLAGLVMSTRCGDLDPGILIDLARQGYNAEQVELLLNHQSGLAGLSGYSSNLAEVIAKAEVGDERCRLAFEVYSNRLKHYLGAFTWQLNQPDAILFTDGIGVSSWQLREKVCSGVENLGIRIDPAANRAADPDRATWVQAEGSTVKILILPTDEERVILDEVMRCL